MEDAQRSTIEKEIKSFFEAMGLEGEMKFSFEEPETARIDIKTEDPGIFIGQQGQALLAIQHVLRIILRRKTGQNVFVDLDINDYKKSKETYLKELAKEVADEVALTKTEKELSPMPAADRRIIHLELSQREDVVTESVGEGEERRVAVRPRQNP